MLCWFWGRKLIWPKHLSKCKTKISLTEKITTNSTTNHTFAGLVWKLMKHTLAQSGAQHFLHQCTVRSVLQWTHLSCLTVPATHPLLQECSPCTLHACRQCQNDVLWIAETAQDGFSLSYSFGWPLLLKKKWDQRSCNLLRPIQLTRHGSHSHLPLHFFIASSSAISFAGHKFALQAAK